mgnify:CR=1 FL=1
MYTNSKVVTWYAGLIGIVLIASGLLGFADNPLIGREDAVFPTGTAHNVVHILTGIVALAIAFGLRGRPQANALIAFGVVYAVVFVALLLSDTLFGLLDPVNGADHVLHAGLAILSIAVGLMSQSSAARTA